VIDKLRVEVDRDDPAGSPHAIAKPAHNGARAGADLKATPALADADTPEVVERERVERALLQLKPSKLALPAPLEDVLSHSPPLDPLILSAGRGRYVLAVWPGWGPENHGAITIAWWGFPKGNLSLVVSR